MFSQRIVFSISLFCFVAAHDWASLEADQSLDSEQGERRGGRRITNTLVGCMGCLFAAALLRLVTDKWLLSPLPPSY